MTAKVSYVYVIYRANGIPCYVGKGKGRRLKMHRTHCHNKFLKRILKKDGDEARIEKVATELSNQESCELEKLLISEIGRLDLGNGPLVNFTNGGEGNLGWSPKPETVEKMTAHLRLLAEERRGKKVGPRPPEWGMAISAAKTGKKMSENGRIAIAAANIFRGKPRSQEWKDNMSRKGKEAWARRKQNEEQMAAYREKMLIQLADARSKRFSK